MIAYLSLILVGALGLLSAMASVSRFQQKKYRAFAFFVFLSVFMVIALGVAGGMGLYHAAPEFWMPRHPS